MNINIQTTLPKMQMPPNLQGSRNSIIEVVLLIIVIVLFSWFLVWPKKAELQTRVDAYKVVEESYNSLAGDVDKLKDLVKQLEASGPEVEKLDEFLPLQERSVVTQLLFTKLAQTSGVVIGDINITSPGDVIVGGDKELLKNPFGPERALKILPVNIVVSGTMSQITDFVRKLENYGRLMDINSLDLSVEKDDILNLRLNLNTYYFPPKQP